ncbi:MAG: hypothetical protein ACRDJE_25285, partial [Dehalococcoidia bacterium]
LAIGFDPSSPAVGALGGATLIVCALRDAGVGRWPAPSLQRQTPRWFRDVFGSTWGSFAWGADLGQGWTSHVLYTGYYGLLVWTVLLGQPLEGALLLAGYGLGRALPVLVAGVVAPRTDPGAFLISPYRRQAMLQQLCAAVLAFAGGYFLITIIG